MNPTINLLVTMFYKSPDFFWDSVTKFGDLFGCLGFLNAIKVVKRRENYAKIWRANGENDAKYAF